MKLLRSIIFAIAVMPTLAIAVGQIGNTPLVVPGTELGWESSRLELVLRVSERTQVKLDVYSPGFDPEDYRSPNELGDERYDKSDRPLKTLIRIFDSSGKVRLRKEYGVEPHRWHKLIDGELGPGDYLIEMQFFGNGKNALAFRLNADPQKAKLQVAPGSMQTYNVHGSEWQYPFQVEKRSWSAPITVGIYDGDGPEELLVQVKRPDGKDEQLPTPGNREWVRYQIKQAGDYKFGFKQPETATQFTNTVGFKIFLGPVKVRVVDESGSLVEGAEYAVNGYYDRTVSLVKVPDGWELLRVEAEYGNVEPGNRVLFGPGGGVVTYVLRRQSGKLAIAARASCGGEEWPVPLELRVGDRRVSLDDNGVAELELPAGSYDVTVQVPGAAVDAPEKVVIKAGEKANLAIAVSPQVSLEMALSPESIGVGEEAQITARLSTDFPYAFPASVVLEIPNGLLAKGALRKDGLLSADRPLTLQTKVRATRPGAFEVASLAVPCAGEASATLKVLEPASFAIKKRAVSERVKVGDEARFIVEVSNTGQRPGRVRLVDELPEGLEGRGVDEYIALDPGETRKVAISARVAAGAAGKLENVASLYDDSGRLIGSDSAFVYVVSPGVTLERTLDKHVVVPGEVVKVCLQVSNPGTLDVKYRLVDAYPEWLEPQEKPEFTGELRPGQEAEHCYDAKVRFGPETEGGFNAKLISNAGNPQASDRIKRVLLGLEKVVEPQKVLVGGKAVFTVKVSNPTDHPVPVRLLDSPAKGLGMRGGSENLVLQPGETKELKYEASPEKAGRLQNKVSVFVSDTPAAFPAKASLVVVPVLEPRRLSEIKLPFNVDGSGDYLLIAHRPPEGSHYELGSSRLNGKPVENPRVTEDGRLIWKVPFTKQGTLSYTVSHKSALPELPEPELSLVAGERVLPLKGDVSLEDYEKARPLNTQERRGMIKEPAPGTVFVNTDSTKIVVVAPYGEEVRVAVNGKPVSRDRLGEAKYNSAAGTQVLAYYGVPLDVGANLITADTESQHDQVEVFRSGRAAKLVAIPEKAIADGRTPIKLRIEQQDAAGLPTGMGFVTVQCSVEPITADANLKESGYQVLLRDGVGELILHPVSSPGPIALKMAKDKLVAESEIYIPGPETTLWMAQGSVTVRYGGSLEVGGRAYGYLETPLSGGTLQGAFGVNASENAGALSVSPDLLNQDDPNNRFPLLGSGEASQLPLQSDDGVAVKYDRESFSVGYYKTNLSLPGIGGLPSATALVAQKRGRLEAAGFLAMLPSSQLTEEIVPDGTRVYRLSEPVKPGSERVILQIGSEETELVPLRDYVIDYPTGQITLARPLWPTTAGAIPVRLQVTYAPETAVRDTLAFGAGAEYDMGRFSFGLAAASLDRGATWKFGAEASYHTETLKVALSYSLDAGKSVVGLSAAGRQGAIEAAGNLRYDGNLQGKARVAARVGKNGKIALEHTGSGTANRSALLYEHRFGNLFGGVGAGYEWNSGTPSALGRLGYENKKLRLSLTHNHSFSVAPSLTSMAASYVFDDNLTGGADLSYEWGTGLSGSLELKERLGPANLSISYALPNASGSGNRARFGIVAPLPLSERLTLDVSAGYDHSFVTGDYQAAAGAGLRYKTDALSATLGVEGALGSSGTKVTLRSGAAGRIDDRQVISFDANYVIDTAIHGRFTLAYAYRGRSLQVLTYHRMTNDNGTSFEGELAPTWHPSKSFQLRPSAAYRVSLDDPGASLYQIGMGANYYFTPRVGLGGGAYYLWQPALAIEKAAFSVEGSVRVVDPVWLNVGYTFGGFDGLMPESRPGWYLRLDLFGASTGAYEEEDGR